MLNVFYLSFQKWYFPSRIVLTKCVENFSKCNLKIFYGIKIEKMEAKVLFEVKAVGRDLGMVRGLHFFNRDTIENFQITRGKIFQTLSQTISGGECFFAQLGYISANFFIHGHFYNVYKKESFKIHAIFCIFVTF